VKTAAQPFRFFTASYLIRIAVQRAVNLQELATGLEESSDESIFHHTFQSLERHHFLTQRFSSDFAQWVLASCNQPELAERLGGLDIRGYVSLAELRSDLRRLVLEYCQEKPQYAAAAGFEPFYFCESVGVTLSLGFEAYTLAEFRSGIERLSAAAVYFHFISSRLRLHLSTNDFSLWLGTQLGLEALARRISRIDIYTNTLHGVRDRLLELIDQEIAA
jgi:hypothetical protein